MTHLSGSNSHNPKDVPNFEAAIFSSIIDILREGESQSTDEDIIEQFSVDAVEFPNHSSVSTTSV